MQDNWTMTVIKPDGDKLNFAGKRTLKEILIGTKKYLNKLKQTCTRCGCNANLLFETKEGYIPVD